MRRSTLILLLFLTLLLGAVAACGEAQLAAPTAAPPTLAPTLAPATATPLVQEPAATATTMAPAPTEGSSSSTSTLSQEAAVLEVDWENRAPFAQGMVDAEEAVLNDLQGATVYHIDVTLSDALTHLEGEEAVLYTNQEDEPLDVVYFRLFPNLAGGVAAVNNVRVNGEPVAPRFELLESAMRVRLPEPLQPGEQVEITMRFAVDVPTEGGGNYNTFVYTEDVLALAHFYPLIPAYDDEGWNVEIPPPSGDVVYADSSFYLVEVTAPAGFTMVASGVPIEEQKLDGRQQVTWAAGPMRDFYLVGSKRFEKLSAEVGETTINSYTFPEYEEAAQDVLDYAADAVAVFDEDIDTYPFTELDIVHTPNLALGIEYPGIIAINQRLYEPDSGYLPGVLESTVAHEVGHQWFYSIVGNDQVDEPWIDESLTQYITMLYFGEEHGPAGRQAFRETLTGRWQRTGEEDMAIGLPVAAYEGNEYSAIVYGRGPLFFEALEERMGEERFDQFLRGYYEAHEWGIASTESLRAVAEQYCECDLGPMFEEWVYP